MATRPVDTNEVHIGPDAPIWQWSGTEMPRTDPELLESFVPVPEYEPKAHLDNNDYEINRIGLLTRLRMNTLDRGIMVVLDKLGGFGSRAAQEINPVEQSDNGERRFRKRTKVIIGAVALAGVAYASERLGLVQEAQHLVHGAYNDAQNIVQNAHEHSHSAKAIHHDAARHTISHSQHTAGHSQSAKQPSSPQNQPAVHKPITQASYNFNAAPGDSITREIQKIGGDHGKHISAQRAFNLYLNIKHKLGGHLAHRQITLPNGEIGLPQGHNSFSPEFVKLVKEYTH
jgi:hypothetical protein